MWREEAHSQRGSRELLSRPERTQRAGGDGSDGARAVVRALTGGAELRAVDWRSGGDSGQASAEAEERPSGCGTSIAVTGGGSISADLGTESGKPRSVKRHLVCKRWTIEKADENSNDTPWFALHRPNSDKLRFHLPSLP